MLPRDSTHRFKRIRGKCLPKCAFWLLPFQLTLLGACESAAVEESSGKHFWRPVGNGWLGCSINGVCLVTRN